MTGTIRTGTGGWTYEPWRGTFYPPGLRQKDEQAYAVEHLTAIEINATYYRLQSPKSFAAWAKVAPDRFRYALKASRYATNRTKLAEAGDSIVKFVGQGISELGDRLGPIVWQFAPTKRFDADDFGAFLKLLPESVDGLALSHALEVRHESFDDPAFVELARAAGAAIVYADDPEYPCIDADTGPFRYARLMQARSDQPTGYDSTEIKGFASLAQSWAGNGSDVYMFFINGAKERAPHAAMALMAELETMEG